MASISGQKLMGKLATPCRFLGRFLSQFRGQFRSQFRSQLIFGLAFGAGLMMSGAIMPALAQDSTPDEELSSRKELTQQELLGLKSQIEISEARKKELDQEISKLEADRAAINRSLIDTSTRSRALEERIERSAARLEELREDEAGVRASLKKRRNLLIEVIAALQRMGHKPPPALLVTPEDALQSVRSAILLGAVVPEVRAETQILATELSDLVRIKEDINSSREKLTADLEGLAEEEQRLSFLLDEKKNLSNSARTELAEQTARAAELAGKAGNLQGLIFQLETEIASVRQAAEAAILAEQTRRENEEKLIAEAREDTNKPNFADTSRIAPAMSFVQAKGLLPKPVTGVELASFEQRTASGEISQGVSIATRSASRVLSPSDGWVIYAGPFRSYGQLLIINAGGGYHVVLAGMERINVELGQFVLAGEPVGIMGASRIASNVNVDVGSTRPVLYVEFRKDGNSIDPSPWWATTSLEESNG
ncbi:MAG: peptidoglycan DD-metalloendopeptidase family protein [Salaquimonas sp.]